MGPTRNGTVSQTDHQFYREYVRARRRVVIPLAATVTGAYMGLVLLANFTSVLDGRVFGSLSWAYLVAFAQFAVALVVTTLYRRQMDRLDAALLQRRTAPVAAVGDDGGRP